MAAGYTTLFRRLGTTEGNFHADFTTGWTGSRRGMNALVDICPDDTSLRSFAVDFHERRLALWAVWKSSLRREFREIVSGLHEAHCAPRLEGGPEIPFTEFEEAYLEWDRYTRQKLEEVVQTHGADIDVTRRVERIRRSLNVVADAYAALGRTI